ncbi:unnamed protein product [Rotaria sp. Silwood1]|nr:unnamed protein product [Rotaria sp. Silwood1]CAF1688275.1 unnamed protein product [Rotaria sp. Silwood1]CAF5019307.1 unnamed protein product [Rotaria sp. Silwood1]
MDLRDEAFYDFIRQISGKRVVELLAFQNCNGVDSFIGCKECTDVLRFESDQLNDLKKNTCITLRDGSVAFLPGLESSISNHIKLLKRAPNTTSSNLATTTVPTYYSTIRTPSPLDISMFANSSNPSSLNFSTTSNPLIDQMSNRISTSIINWLKKSQQELNLMNKNFQQGIDFLVELNKQRDGIILVGGNVA